MIYEMRTYQVQPGKAGEFLKLYQEQGLHLISRYAKLIGCWTQESGVLNSVVFLWAYDDLGHRAALSAHEQAQRTAGQWSARPAEGTRASVVAPPGLLEAAEVLARRVEIRQAFGPTARTEETP